MRPASHRYLPHQELRLLSVRQPYAFLLVAGKKQFETRSWRTHYRGWVAIHAGLQLAPGGMRALRDLWRRCQFIGEAPPFTRGAIVGLARLDAVSPTTDSRLRPTRRERLLGDWTDGRFAWRMSMPMGLRKPIPYRGRLGIPALGESLREQVAELQWAHEEPVS